MSQSCTSNSCFFPLRRRTRFSKKEEENNRYRRSFFQNNIRGLLQPPRLGFHLKVFYLQENFWLMRFKTKISTCQADQPCLSTMMLIATSRVASTVPYWCVAVALVIWIVDSDQIVVDNHLSWSMCMGIFMPRFSLVWFHYLREHEKTLIKYRCKNSRNI